MATGKLGAFDLALETLTTVYTCPADVYTIASLNLCNRTTNDATIRVAVCNTGTPGDEDYIEYGIVIPANNVLERTGIVLSAGQRIVVNSSIIYVSAVVFGIETPTT